MPNGRFNSSQIPPSREEEAEKLQKWTLNTERSLKEKEGKLQQYSGETATHQNQILSLQKQNENLHSEIRQLKEEKAELCEKVDDTKLQSSLLSSQSSKLSNQIDSIQATQSTVTCAQETKDDQLHGLFQQLERLKITKDQKIEEANEKLHSMTIKSKNLAEKEELQNQEAKLANIKNELACKQKEKELLTKEMETYVQELRKEEDEIIQIKLSHKNALEKLDGTKMAFIDSEQKLMDTISTISNNIEMLSQENKDLSKSIEENNSAIEILSSKVRESSAIKVDLQNQLDKKVNEKNDVKKDMDIIVSELSKSNDKMESMKHILSDIDTMNQDIVMLTEDLGSCTEKKVLAEKEVEELKKVQKQKFLLEEENVTLTGKIKVLEDKIIKIEVSHKDILRENDSAQKSVDEIKIKIKKKGDELNCLNKEVHSKIAESSAANANKVALQKSIAQSETKVKLLQNNLQGIESLIDEKNEQNIFKCKENASQATELQNIKNKIEAVDAQLKDSINKGKHLDIEIQKNCSSIETRKIECDKLNADILSREESIKIKEDEKNILVLKHNSLLQKLEEETKSKDELLVKTEELNEEIVSIEKALETINLDTDNDCTSGIEDDNKQIKQLEKSLKQNEKCIATNKKKYEKMSKQIEKLDNLLMDQKSELKLSDDKIKVVETKITSANQDISEKVKQISAVNTKHGKLEKTLNEKTKANIALEQDIKKMEKKLQDISQGLTEQMDQQKIVGKKTDSSLEAIGIEHKKAIEELQKEKSDLANKLGELIENVNVAKLNKKTKEAQDKDKAEDELANDKMKLEKAKTDLDKSRQAQREEIKNKNLKVNAMRAELEKIKSNDHGCSSQNTSNKGDHVSSSHSGGAFGNKFDENFVTPMKAPMRISKGDTLKNKIGESITSKFKSTDVYNFGSSSDSDAFSLDVDISKESSLKSLKRGGLPTPLSVTRFKPTPKAYCRSTPQKRNSDAPPSKNGLPTPLAMKRTPKTYSRSTPQKKNSAPAPPKEQKPQAKPLKLFSNILSPLSEGSESN